MSISGLCRRNLSMALKIESVRPSSVRPIAPFQKIIAAGRAQPCKRASERARDKHHHPSKIHPSIRPLLLLYLSKKEQRTAAKSPEIPGPRSPTSAAPVGRPL